MPILPGAKMLACKGIFTTPSIDTAVKRPQKAERLLGILLYKIPYVSIITHFIKKIK